VTAKYDVIVVGAGANGLAAAAFLARAGRKALVLDRRGQVGGTSGTEEFLSGFRVGACRDDPGWIPDRLIRDLRLRREGLAVWPAPVGLVAARPDKPPLVVWPNAATTAAGLREVSSHDAARWSAFCKLVADVARTLQGAYAAPPPRVQSDSITDLMTLASLGRRLRALGKREMMEVLRAIPMPVADLAEEWFDDTVLASAIATLGVDGVLHGPMSSGTAFVLFHKHVGALAGYVGVRRVVRGGVGTLAAAIAAAALASGVEIRTGAEVQRIQVDGSGTTGVVLASGEEIRSPVVMSSADPRRTFSLIDPLWLDADLTRAIDNVRMRGATARVHFALDGLPAFTTGGRAWEAPLVGGTIVITPDIAGLERAYDDAKYGLMPAEPALSVTIPSVLDSTLAPPGRHVMSVTVHHAPYARTSGWGTAERSALGDQVEAAVSRVAWDFRERILERSVLTPVDLESRYGATEGSLTHGELALDQILFMRPVPSCARYATPVRGLWLCGIGSHPASASGASGMMAARAVLRGAR
jgi:phytoene dehydrogenase-like protein